MSKFGLRGLGGRCGRDKPALKPGAQGAQGIFRAAWQLTFINGQAAKPERSRRACYLWAEITE